MAADSHAAATRLRDTTDTADIDRRLAAWERRAAAARRDEVAAAAHAVELARYAQQLRHLAPPPAAPDVPSSAPVDEPPPRKPLAAMTRDELVAEAKRLEVRRSKHWSKDDLLSAVEQAAALADEDGAR